jgi:hypothetical protein
MGRGPARHYNGGASPRSHDKRIEVRVAPCKPPASRERQGGGAGHDFMCNAKECYHVITSMFLFSIFYLKIYFKNYHSNARGIT